MKIMHRSFQRNCCNPRCDGKIAVSELTDQNRTQIPSIHKYSTIYIYPKRLHFKIEIRKAKRKLQNFQNLHLSKRLQLQQTSSRENKRGSDQTSWITRTGEVGLAKKVGLVSPAIITRTWWTPSSQTGFSKAFFSCSPDELLSDLRWEQARRIKATIMSPNMMARPPNRYRTGEFHLQKPTPWLAEITGLIVAISWSSSSSWLIVFLCQIRGMLLLFIAAGWSHCSVLALWKFILAGKHLSWGFHLDMEDHWHP